MVKDNKKKILIIQHYSGMGGSTLSCFDIIRSLDFNLYEVLLSLPAGNSDARKLADQYKVNVIESSVPVINFTYHNASSGVIRSILKFISSSKYQKQWRIFLRQINPDLVILNSSIQAPMIKVIKNCGISCICFVRETIRGNAKALGNHFLASMLKRADGITFLTEYDKISWNISKKIPQKVIPDVVDSKHFQFETNDYDRFVNQNNIFTDALNLVYFGGFSYIKGVHNLVQAFQYLYGLNINLYILGDDGDVIRKIRGIKKFIYYKEVKCIKFTDKIISKINDKSQKIHVLGIQMNTSNWYKMADAVVFPVQQVHQARPVYEAGYYSKTAIVPNFKNFQDNIIDGYNGLLYKRSSVKELADHIKKLYYDPLLKKKLGENNKIMTEQKHNEELLRVELNNLVGHILCDYEGG